MYTGIAIALAWPETLCKQAGAWYDGLMQTLGFSQNHYYKVGHAAVVLVEIKSGNCYYFDFGRYHAPFGYGRVRDVETDDDLIIHTKAKFDENQNILNLDQLLKELSDNEACHGSGTLHASYSKIDFEIAFKKAKSMQERNPWKYGPFVWNGTNCSRFVRTAILNGNPPLLEKLKLAVPYTISPSPIGIVNCLNGYQIHYKTNKACSSSSAMPSFVLGQTLQQPERLDCIPKNSQWLSGEGAGSWFHISPFDDKFAVTRYSPDGKIECSDIFETGDGGQLNLNTPFEIIHLSNCEQVCILQNNEVLKLKRTRKTSAVNLEESKQKQTSIS